MSDADFWNEAWAADSVPRCSPHDPTLQMHWPSLGVRAGSRVLVPLSGKSADLTWLAANGYEPVGVDIAAAPCKQYFADRGVVPSLDRAGRFVRWRGAGVTILQGDIFDLDGSYEAAVDRGALVAVSPRDRARYADSVRAHLTDDARILLVTIEYDAGRRNRPPYPVFPDEVGRLFPGVVEVARHPLERPRWQRIGGATTVVWTVGKPAPGRPEQRG